MGHHYNTVRGIGKDKEDAKHAAIDQFLYENGHRHSVRGVESAKMIRKVPPQKQVEEKKAHRVFGYAYPQYTTYIRMVDDPDAPPEKWLEEWEFELHTHA